MYELFSVINSKLNVRIASMNLTWNTFTKYEYGYDSPLKVTLQVQREELFDPQIFSHKNY